MARVVLYGLSRTGEVQLTELLDRDDPRELRGVAESRLSAFERVEVWVESVCVVKLQRSVA